MQLNCACSFCPLFSDSEMGFCSYFYNVSFRCSFYVKSKRGIKKQSIFLGLLPGSHIYIVCGIMCTCLHEVSHPQTIYL